MLSRLMIDQGDLVKTVAIQEDPEVYHEAGTLNIDDETIRERIEADIDFKIPGLPTTFYCEARAKCQRSRIGSEN